VSGGLYQPTQASVAAGDRLEVPLSS
jgi:hypothetical protein